MENIKFTKVFKSEVYCVNDIIQELMTFLSKNLPALSPEDKGDFRLIFSELLFNAVIHGNNQDINKSITLCVEILPSNIVFSSIQDEGKGFDFEKLLNQNHSSENEAAIFSENGRGIKLVSSLTDKLSFNSIGNQIKFYKRVKAYNG